MNEIERILKKRIHFMTEDPVHTNNVFLIFPILIILLLLLYYLFTSPVKNPTSVQEGIAKEIIRFHVIANSDSDKDQALKLKVKDAVVVALEEPLEDAGSIEDARNILIENIPLINQVALNNIKEEGYDYGVNVNLSDTYFPTKIYGDMTFPPGIYEAVRIEIGEAKGKNWWCVMFPPLCFVDGTYNVVPDKSKSQLKYVLTEKEYTSLMKKGKVKVKGKFKIQEIVTDWIR